MRMTDIQATSYCRAKAIRGEASQEWNTLRTEIEKDGLDIVERRRSIQQTSTLAPRVDDDFLAAIYDEQEIKRAIAGEVKERVKKEIDEKSSFPLRVLYLQYLRNHLGNVQDEAADLEAFQTARNDIEQQLKQFETEYSAWITDAILAQED